MEIAGATAGCGLGVLKELFVELKRKRQRVKNIPDNFSKLHTSVDSLEALWAGINEAIERNPLLVKTKFYTKKNNKVDETVKKFREIEKEYEAANQKTCIHKFLKLARLDKDIEKLISEIGGVENNLQIDWLTRPTLLNVKVVEKKGMSGYVIPSQKDNLDNLVKCLNDSNNKRIGICGAAGVGKTYLLKTLNDSLPSETLSFDYIIWLEAPGQGNITETMHEEIIARLKLSKGETKRQNTEIISTVLSMKKCLFLIDDFHQLVKLEEIGIIEANVVVAAKSEKAMRDLNLDQIIKINTLSAQEGGDLFRHYVQDYIQLSYRLKNLIYDFIQLLGGLPVVIIFVATYLNKHKDYESWEGLLNKSKMGTSTLEFLGMEALMESYKTVYNDLGGDEYKKCLLYAALFPSNSNICRKMLVECWKSENFLQYNSRSLLDARVEGRLIMNKLEENAMFESCGYNFVKMSVFFRKMALGMHFPEMNTRRMCVISTLDTPIQRVDNNVTGLSLIGGSQGITFTQTPQWVRMSTLFLQFHSPLKMGSDFFTNMNELRVLGIQNSNLGELGTGIQPLPQSISNLGKLKSLYLNNCGNLTQLPITMVQLKELEILDISGTTIKWSTTVEIVMQLQSLLCLRFTFPVIEGGNIFPPSMHTSLPKLEEVIVVIGGEVTREICDTVRIELAQFKERKFCCDLVAYWGRPDDSYSRVCEFHPELDANQRMSSHLGQILDALIVPESNNVADAKSKGKGPIVPNAPQSKGKGQSAGGIVFREGNSTPTIAAAVC